MLRRARSLSTGWKYAQWNRNNVFHEVVKPQFSRLAPDVQLHKCDIVSDTMQKDDCFVLMKPLRKDDKFHEGITQEEMVKLFFPKTTSDMAASLSNVTSAFYGVMLQSTGKVIGMQNINEVSRDFFYTLGKTKTMLTRKDVDGKYEIPKDARGVVILLVSAIYNASPEYKFNITKFDKEHCEIELTGVDRYLRITKTLGISEHLQWPVLHRFMEGINDELQANVEVESEMLKGEDNGECHERFTMRKR